MKQIDWQFLFPNINLLLISFKRELLCLVIRKELKCDWTREGPKVRGNFRDREKKNQGSLTKRANKKIWLSWWWARSWKAFIKTDEKRKVERGLLHDPPNPAKLINAAYWFRRIVRPFGVFAVSQCCSFSLCQKKFLYLLTAVLGALVHSTAICMLFCYLQYSSSYFGF